MSANVSHQAPVPSTGVFNSPGVTLCINTEWVSHIDGLLERLLSPTAWIGTESEIEAAIQEVHKLLVKFADVGECQLVAIGDIKQGVQYTDHNGWLKCDGRQLSIASYPDLAAAMGAGGWNVDEEFFNLPNFVGRVPVGAGTSPQSPAQPRAQGVYLGADFHTLNVNQIPSHNHAQNVTNNTPARVFSTATAGGSSPEARATPAGQPRIFTDSTGGGEAHNNMQSSLTVNFFIYAGAG